MKQSLRRYKQGEIPKIKKKLSPKNKKILENFLKLCSINAGKKKLEKIERIILQFYDVTKHDLSKKPKHETIIDFLSVVNNSDRSFWTKNEIKVYLKKFLLYKYKDIDLVKYIKKSPKEDKISENDLITEEELESMIRKAKSFKQKALIMLEFEAGLRPQELSNLQWKDVNYYDGYGTINVFSNKTKKNREYPIKEAVIHLKRWYQEYEFPNVSPEDYIFPNPQTRKQISSTAILKTLRKVAIASGIKKRVWTYLFRHSRATRLYEELPQPMVEKLLGHKNMAHIYGHISNKKAREVMLKKIYHIKELTEEDKEQIKKIKEQFKKSYEEQKKEVERLTELQKDFREKTEKDIEEYRETLLLVGTLFKKKLEGKKISAEDKKVIVKMFS